MDYKELFGEETGPVVEKVIKEKELVLIEKKSGDWMPREKFNAEQEKLKSQITTLEEKVTERDQNIVDLTEKAQKGENLTEELETLKTQGEDAKKKYTTDLRDQRLDAEIKLSLVQAGAKHPEILVSLVNKDAVTDSTDGKSFIGIKEQVDAMKEGDYKDQFEEILLEGDTPLEGDLSKIKNPWMPENYSVFEQSLLLKKDPALAARLRKEAGKG